MATFGARIKAAMSKLGHGTTQDAEPAAKLYNLWMARYQPSGKDHMDSVTRQAFHKWLKSTDKIPPISAHHLYRLADILDVMPRWLMYGIHMGDLSMTATQALKADELKLVDYYRQISGQENKERVMNRAKDLAEDSKVRQ
jgi:hypothetical protein